MNPKLIAAILIFVLAGLFQNTGFFSIFGIKPNLLLAALVALSFFVKDILVYSSFILAAVILLFFQSGIMAEQLVLALIGLAAFPVGRRLPGSPLFNNLLMVGAGTILFYLFVAPSFLISAWPAVIGELVYNLLWGFIFFNIFELCLKTNSILRT